jgi:hypothetical protein
LIIEQLDLCKMHNSLNARITEKATLHKHIWAFIWEKTNRFFFI